MKSVKHILLASLFLGLLVGCQPEPDEQKLLDELVVSTNVDEAADFSSYRTYALPTDTIGFVSDTDPNDSILFHPRSNYPRPVLQQIESNLNARGFTRVDRNDNPDIGVNVYVVNNLNLFQSVYYPNYYYPYYYGYSSFYYYPYVNTYVYNTGALVIEIIDLNDINPQNQVKVVWNAYMGDIYSTFSLIQQSTEAIDQAFVQSPYLSTGL